MEQQGDTCTIPTKDSIIIFIENDAKRNEVESSLFSVEVDDNKLDNVPLEVHFITKNECNGLFDKYSISEKPTFIRFKNGKEIRRFEGIDENKIKELMELNP